MSLELKTVHIKEMTLKGFDAEIDLQITNPNWFTVRISDLDYHAYISGEEIASGQAGTRNSLTFGLYHRRDPAGESELRKSGRQACPDFI